MGQTQILLLVLGVLVVAVAIYMGMSVYSDNMTNANFDSLLRDSISIATSAQAWKRTPQMLGGSPDMHKPDPKDYTDATFLSIGFSTQQLPNCYTNLDGTFGITPTGDGLLIVATNTPLKNRVVVLVSGTGDSRVAVQDGPVDVLKIVKGGYFVDSDVATTVSPPSECSELVD